MKRDRAQDGSEGCNNAHESCLMPGWAGAMIGLTEDNAWGSVELVGNNIGDLNDL